MQFSPCSSESLKSFRVFARLFLVKAICLVRSNYFSKLKHHYTGYKLVLKVFMPGLLMAFWKVSETPMCLSEVGEHGVSWSLPLLPGLAAGKESRMGTGGQRSLQKKMQRGFFHWTKSLYSCTSLPPHLFSAPA